MPDFFKTPTEAITIVISLLPRNPSAAAELLCSCLDTNGKDLESCDLLVITDLGLFREEGMIENEGTNPQGLDEMAAHSKIGILFF